MSIKQVLFAGGMAALACAAQGFQISSLSPQGEVARVRQVVLKFDDSAVNFGDPKAPAPLTLSCSDAQASKGSGRWISDRQWAYEFERDLPPGISCSLQLRTGLKSVKGEDLKGATSYQFNSGGPFVQNIRPYGGSRIDEEQFFTLQLNGPATLASVQANVWCLVDGLGERVVVRLIDGAERAALLKSQGLERSAGKTPLSFVTLACNRRLTPATKVQLVYGKGVTTPGAAGSAGVPNSVERRFNFQVREPFAASFSCERENAQAACLPILPMRLSFNAPVPRKLAEGIRLKSDKDSFKPTLDQEDGEGDAGGSARDGDSVDPTRDTLLADSTPIDYLDFASPVSGLGSKMGLDATNKWPGETSREWGRPLQMDAAVSARVEQVWQALGL